MRLKTIILTLLAFVLLAGGAAWAASDTEDLTINCTVAARAKLALTPTTINFPDADPDDTPSIPADNTVSVSSKIRSSSDSNLTVLANGDLTAGTNTIGINNVTWTASGSGYVGGTMNKTTSQSVGSWAGPSSGNKVGTLTFSLANSWGYAPGSYTATATYTLTAP
jgi:hypothetical protein